MNPQENSGNQEDPPQESPAIRMGPAGRSRQGPGHVRARLILAAAAVTGGLLGASAIVNAFVASGSGGAATVAGQPTPAAEALPGPADAAAPTPSATVSAPAAATAAPVKAAAKAPAKAPATRASAAKAPAKAPAPVRKAAPTPAKAPSANTYTVVAGDTVGSIAARSGVDVNSMLAANGLGAYSIIVPGQTLKLTGPAVAVPKAAAAPAPAPAPARVAPAAPAQAAPAAPAPAPAPAVRTIYVAGAGGQALVDSCIGPIHFTPTDGYSLFITEHDFCGGWARFSGIGVGERVDIPGYGSYTVAARSQVPNPGTTNDVAAVFGGFPRAVLQTCIPGTSQMLVIALN